MRAKRTTKSKGNPDSKTADARSKSEATKAHANIEKLKSAKTMCDESKRVSALDAAAVVLKRSDRPMNCTELIRAMAERGLWKSPSGKTPQATLSAAIYREINTKGHNARFTKTERGQYTFNQGAKR